MIKDFWNTNLNPITMYPPMLDHKYQTGRTVQKKISDRQHVSADLSEDPDYIPAKEAMAALGVGSKKIKQSILDNGLEFIIFISKGISYYKRCDVENIEIVAPSIQNMDEYISGTELRGLNAWSYWDLWSHSRKNKWKKKKFSGNMTWFLRSEVLKSE